MGGTYNFVLTFLLDISPLHEQLFKSPGSHDDPMFECSMVQAAYLRGRPSVVCDLMVILPIPCMCI